MNQATDPAIDLLALENQFCFALYSTSLALTKAYKPLLEQLGLTYPQYLVMLVLWQHDEQLVKDIGARLHLDSGTLTPLLKRLEQAGLIRRQRNPADERSVQVCLSDAGRALRSQAGQIPLQILCASGQSAATLGSLREQLLELRTALSDSV